MSTGPKVAPIFSFYFLFFFFFNDTAPTEFYTLSLHDALPVPVRPARRPAPQDPSTIRAPPRPSAQARRGRGDGIVPHPGQEPDGNQVGLLQLLPPPLQALGRISRSGTMCPPPGPSHSLCLVSVSR